MHRTVIATALALAADAQAALLRAFDGHDAAVWDARWSPDGTRVASVSSDGMAAVWDVDSGEERHRLAPVGDGGRPVTVGDRRALAAAGFHLPPGDGAAIWAEGEPMGMKPLGLAALDMLRVEAGLIFANYEFSDQTDPFEAGIGFTVPLKTQNDDFIGRKAIEARKAAPQRKLVGLEVEGGVVPSTGDCLRIGKAQVGEITSAYKSPILGKTIALARVYIQHAEPGTEIEVGQLDGMQKRLKATVCAFPHFDPTKSRVKGEYS